MSKLTIVYGGQYGSEGKGQIVSFIAGSQDLDWAVRVGGPNAGHTFKMPSGHVQVLQTIPVPSFYNRYMNSCIGAAGLIIPHVFYREVLDAYAVINAPPVIWIDESVAVITREHMDAEHALKGNIGSTGEGVGAASAERIMRDPEMVIGHPRSKQAFMAGMKKDRDTQHPFENVHVVEDTALMLNQALRRGDHLLIEGTQGVELSLYTSGHYPFCTSRECTPQSMLAQTGIAQENADIVEKIMVVRTFPIRVGGNSGDLPNEISWDELELMTDGYVSKPEITTVTKKKRRIANIDMQALGRVVKITRPTSIALTFFDYWFPKVGEGLLMREHWERIEMIERSLNVPVKYLSTGFGSVRQLR